MACLGNDIIALKTIDIARTKSPRFYSKILAAPEQQLYHRWFSNLPFEDYVWLLWSIKESAYKCLQRYQADLVFTPVKVEITKLTAPAASNQPLLTSNLISTGFNNDECFKSIITCKSQTLYARSVIYGDELIHTVAQSTNDFKDIHWGIKQIDSADPASQSAEARAFVLDRLKPVFSLAELRIEKSASGYPFVLANGAVLNLPVSLSHHDRFVAYAFIATASPETTK